MTPRIRLAVDMRPASTAGSAEHFLTLVRMVTGMTVSFAKVSDRMLGEG